MRVIMGIILAVVLGVLAGCSTNETSTEVPQNQEDEVESDSSDGATIEDGGEVEAGQRMDDELATETMYELIAGVGPATTALDRIVQSGDERFIPVLIEVLRARQIGIVTAPAFDQIGSALNIISGQPFGSDWGSWVEWYGATDIEPPPGFVGWKGELFARIDPDFAMFLQDDLPQQNIRVEEIAWGGVALDGIPALDEPRMLSPEDAEYLNPQDPVFGVVINGDARAYPLRIIDWHEMANDTVGGVPISLAYCTLCGAAIAFDGRASDGNTYTFGSSGFLYRSNKLMYDRQTFTLWNQLTGEPVLGELAGTDARLDYFPTVLTTWEEWQDQHPETVVLDIQTGFSRPYDQGAAYGDYFSSPDTMFPVWQRSGQFDTKSQVYALRINDVPKAYPVEILSEEQVVNDEVAGKNVVLVVGEGDIIEVEGESRRIGPVTYSAGAEVRAYERGAHTFSAGSDRQMVVDEDGSDWEVTEEALLGPDGEELARVSGHLAYWFGWYAFFPQTLVYEGAE